MSFGIIAAKARIVSSADRPHAVLRPFLVDIDALVGPFVARPALDRLDDAAGHLDMKAIERSRAARRGWRGDRGLEARAGQRRSNSERAQGEDQSYLCHVLPPSIQRWRPLQVPD